MRIKSNLPNNLGISAKGKRILVPARGVLEIADEGHEAHIAIIQKHVDAGNLEFLKKPAESEEVKAARLAKEVAAAKALLAQVEGASKTSEKKEGDK